MAKSLPPPLSATSWRSHALFPCWSSSTESCSQDSFPSRLTDVGRRSIPSSGFDDKLEPEAKRRGCATGVQDEVDQRPSLTDLGEDLVMRILQAARPSAWELCRWAGVCRQWKTLCYSPVFWSKLCIGQGSVRKGVEQLATRCSMLVELHIDDPRCDLHILHPIIVACGSTLRRVSIECDRDRTSRTEASICSILWIMSLYCKNLQSISLLSTGEEVSLGQLENKVMWYLTSGFRQISSFTSCCRNSVTKQAVYLMVIAWQELSSLHVHIGGLALEDLMALKKCCALRLLEIVGAEAGLVGKAPPGLVLHREVEVLIMNHTSMDIEEIALLVGTLPGLKWLVLKRWLLLDSLSEQEKKAQVEILRKSVQTNLACRNLQLWLEV
eukprot:TRINITY_DN3337_c0_g1_i1.p1 TRINITY_DN3337_c0_g1~~TRINITY_DN3337_c0_g1_i1.p1  ORF type:complete len:383 (+),score=15.34 TRINITY_DN3337_c0_g1_i1:37-1185(+)